jgi:hypothetical protein
MSQFFFYPFLSPCPNKLINLAYTLLGNFIISGDLLLCFTPLKPLYYNIVLIPGDREAKVGNKSKRA